MGYHRSTFHRSGNNSSINSVRDVTSSSSSSHNNPGRVPQSHRSSQQVYNGPPPEVIEPGEEADHEQQEGYINNDGEIPIHHHPPQQQQQQQYRSTASRNLFNDPLFHDDNFFNTSTSLFGNNNPFENDPFFQTPLTTAMPMAPIVPSMLHQGLFNQAMNMMNHFTSHTNFFPNQANQHTVQYQQTTQPGREGNGVHYTTSSMARTVRNGVLENEVQSWQVNGRGETRVMERDPRNGRERVVYRKFGEDEGRRRIEGGSGRSGRSRDRRRRRHRH